MVFSHFEYNYQMKKILATNLDIANCFNFHKKKINIIKYFENLTIRLHVFYVLNTHVKFRFNLMLFIIP